LTTDNPLLRTLSKEIKVTDGIVSSLAGLKNDPSRIQITAPLQPGNSGGPVVDERGAVVGVSVSGMLGQKIQNVNFAIKKDSVLGYLSKIGFLLISRNKNKVRRSLIS